MNTKDLIEEGRAFHGGQKSHHGDVIDFSANINPYPPPEALREAYESAFDSVGEYPDDSYSDLRESLSRLCGVSRDNVVPTNGAAEALRLVSSVVVDEGDTVAVPSPGFAEYAREARLHGAEVVEYGTPPDTESVVSVQPDVAFVCNPNNPTGELTRRDEILEVAEALSDRGSYLVVDEAFIDLSRGESVAPELPENAVAVHSLTKSFGIPGLRLGYVVARGETVEAVEAARPAWNVNTAAAEVGKEAARHTDYVEESVEAIESERERIVERLGERVVTESATNFLLVDVSPLSSEEAVEELLGHQNGVLVRDCSSFEGLEDTVRVAVRTPEENTVLLEALEEVLSSSA
ncbi:MAG: threonine-phosphate decarboxylase CobD [Halobacteria archaeon]|nr:threonine-phosphate decarboxylase CobD [Halobacteria archaeon]